VIIRIAAEPAVFDPSAYRAPDLQAAHTRLLDLWREVGAVSCPRREDVEKLPQNLRKRWEKALLRDRLFSEATYRRLGESLTLGDALAIEGIELACLSPPRADKWEVYGDDRCSFRSQDGKVEVCSISVCDRSEVAREARRKASEPISEGMTPQKVWEERFSRLVSFCKQSAIVMDRYGFEQPDGLRFVLDRLTDDLAQTVSVEVYGAVDSNEVLVSFNQLRGEFDGRWSNRGGTLSFYPTEGSFFGRVRGRHDRYIRFDRTVCSIGRGIVVFGRASKHTTFQMVPIDEETRDHEKRLREAQRHPLLPTRQV